MITKTTITKRIAALLVLSVGVCAQQVPPEKLPAPEPALQARLRRVLAADSAEAQRAALDALRTDAGATHERLVPQLFLFLQAAHDTREAMLPGFVLRELSIPPAHVCDALVPLLEGADGALRAALGNVLSAYEDRSAERGASFTVYRAQLERGAPPGLVRYLVEVDPDAALLALTRAEVPEQSELRALLWAQHEVADALWKLRYGFVAPAELARAVPEAATQLDVLAGHPRWWARLYAVQVAREAPALLAATRLAELRDDAHPLVRELAGTLAQEKR